LAARFEAEGDQGMSAAGLYRAVGIYELDREFAVSSRKQLSVSHLRLVLGLPPGDQRDLLTRAETGGWTTENMDAAVRQVRERATREAKASPGL
jgi:hypothetical protein